MFLSELNVGVLRFINNLGKDFIFLNPIAIFFAEYMVYFLALGMLVYWFTRTRTNRMMIIQALTAFLVAEVLGKLSGYLYSHNQPFAELPNINKLIEHAVDNSFPSDHTILFFSISFSIWLVRNKDGMIWFMVAGFVGFSRVWVGVHYPVDIVIGALLGIISAAVTYLIAPKLSVFRSVLGLYEKMEDYVLSTRKISKNKNRNM